MTNDNSQDHRLETYKSLITLSIEGFKFSFLANGGSAVALLAYLGNIAGKNMPVPNMRYSMAAFLAGVACCGVAMLLAYLTQLKLFHEIAHAKTDWFKHNWLLWSAIILFLSSLIAFIAGSWFAINSFP